MNEKSLEVLDQYDLNIYRSVRGRGGMIVVTDQGDKLLLECVKQDKYYKREDVITRAVKQGGYEYLDTYVRNKDGEIISEAAEEGRKYVLKDMYSGSECNVKSIRDILDAVSAMARLHIALDRAVEAIMSEDNEFVLARGNVAKTIIRHTKEMRMAGNYLKNKKQKTEYEMSIYRNIGRFYAEAQTACSMLDDETVVDGIAKADSSNSLIHGNFTYHNIIISNVGTAVTNMEKCRVDSQVFDLYQFMRKILEKYNWDIDLAYKMLNEYDRIKRISDEDIGIMSVLFAFPEKFWKIVNHYYNMNKAWVSPKSIEKLNGCVEQNVRRLDFVATICAL